MEQLVGWLELEGLGKPGRQGKLELEVVVEEKDRLNRLGRKTSHLPGQILNNHH